MDPQAPPQAPVNQAPEAPVVDPKQQIVEKIQAGKNVLVTVRANPTVDELASALGLTFLLGKLDKHATAVFSGKIPPAMEFLDPENTFENTVDSLRDFIIALDKEKADKLRYKVEDDVVKIFITPYRTVLSEKDLNFSQGDFNIDVVVALGVVKREDLDKAITAHGKILHDATVITVNAGAHSSDLGVLDWNEPEASSVAEMLIALSESFGGSLLDAQISTAFLTGIVAETNRFSNEKTSPKVMTLSAQLMAAGANQQLIATNLRQEGMISEPVRKKESDQPHDDDGEMVLDHKDEAEVGDTSGSEAKSEADKVSKKTSAKKAKKESVLPVEEPVEDTDKPGESKEPADEPSTQLKAALDKANQSDDTDEPEQLDNSDDTPDTLAKGGPSDFISSNSPDEPSAPSKSSPADVEDSSMVATPPVSVTSSSNEPVTATPAPHTPLAKPTFGGTLNATAIGDDETVVPADDQAGNLTLTHNEAAVSSQAVDDARQAVEAADTSSVPDTTVSAQQSSVIPQEAAPAPPEPSPVDAFMTPHTQPSPTVNAGATPPPLPPLPGAPSDDPTLPPLPPLPGTAPADNSLPPLPPLPGASPTDPTQPQITPSFMQDMTASQNPWTDAGEAVADKQANQTAERQAKMDQMSQQYTDAVEKNRQLQGGVPPTQKTDATGLPPLPPLPN